MNLLKAIIYQGKRYGFIKSFLIDKNGYGVFFKRSHFTRDNNPKITYNHEKAQLKLQMQWKKNMGEIK